MKKSFYMVLFALTFLIGFTSCSEEQLTEPSIEQIKPVDKEIHQMIVNAKVDGSTTLVCASQGGPATAQHVLLIDGDNYLETPILNDLGVWTGDYFYTFLTQSQSDSWCYNNGV